MAPSKLLQYTENDRVALLKEFDRTPENIKVDINSIKNWLEKQSHLPEIPSDDLIEKFLFIGKFIFSRVKTTIDLYYSTRSLLPEFFKDPDSKEMQDVIELLYFFPMPKLTEERSRVLIHRLRKIPSDEIKLNPYAYISYCVNLADIFINEDCACPKIIIYDGTDTTMNFVISFSPSLVKKAVAIFEKVFSHRVKQIHIVNMPPFVESLFLLVKSCINIKVYQRVQIHKNVENLSDFISKDILPIEYGGYENSLEVLHGLWQEKFRKTSPLFKKRNSLKTNESLRPDGKQINCEMLGIEGNFRKLDVD